MNLNFDPNSLKVYSESRKRRVYVGALAHHLDRKIFEFVYDKAYLRSRNAIPLGPELSLRKVVHLCPEGKLFPSFLDRIPSKENPAYNDYCLSEGISPDEKNPILLLTTIGKRGPSTFIFEAVLEPQVDIRPQIKHLRETLGLSQRDLATAFDLNVLTLIRLEQGKSKDKNLIRLVQIYLKYPEVALDQFKIKGPMLHQKKLTLLKNYFRERIQEIRGQQKTRS